MKRINVLFLFIYLFTQSSFGQQISVNNNYTNQQLIDAFINGTCSNVLNVQFNGYTFADGVKSWGYFNNNQSTFPFNEGIVLTTGKLSAAPGPNSSILSDGPSSWLGDTDLENAVNINNTYNATSIIFEFVPTANTLSFDYIFASEQYLINGTPNQCNYTDGFAFILTNLTTGTNAQNLAVVPGTTTPVTSSTIRGTGGLCPASNAQYFASYNDITAPIAYNGNTIPMHVETNVIPGNTYRIKIVIADQGNQFYDSAVFLRANSFNSEVNLGTNKLIANQTALCQGESLTLNANIPNATYQWFKNDILINNANQATYTVTQPGTYRVAITQNNNCVSEGEIIIEYDNFTYNNDVSFSVCGIANENSASFNLIDIIPLIEIDQADSINFFQTNTNGQLSDIINTNVPFIAANGTQIYTRIISENGCEYFGTVTLLINSENINPITITKCDLDAVTNDGATNFNLNEIEQIIRTENNYTTDYDVQFYLNVTDANNSVNQLPINFVNTTPYEQQIVAKISINGTCVALVKVNLRVLNTENIPVQEISLCQGDTITISATAVSNQYQWNTGETTQSIVVSEPGLYEVKYISDNGCEIFEKFNIQTTTGPNNVEIITTDFEGSNNSINIIVNDPGNFEYSIDGIHYQLTNKFTNLAPGSYTVYIRDLNGCGEKIITVFILDYPRFFTPNDDGFNDTWRIPNLTKMDPDAIVQIFDRYGILIYQFPAQFSWNGKRNGKEMPNSDYWFVVKYKNGKELRGHFSLIR